MTERIHSFIHSSLFAQKFQ